MMNDKRLKLAIAVDSFPKRMDSLVGGVQAASAYLAQAFGQRDDLEVVVLIAGPNAREWEGGAARIGSTVVKSLGVNRILPRYLQTFFDAPRRIRRWMRAEGGLLHVQAIAHWAVGLGTKAAVMLYGIAEKDALYRGTRIARHLKSAVLRSVEGRARRRVAALILTSPYIHQFLTPVEGQRVYEVGNPIADTYFEVSRRMVRGRLFCGASLIERKNILGLLNAFALIAPRRSNLVLRIAGFGLESAYGQECLRRAASLGLADRVRFLGALSVSEVQQELAASELLVLPSFQETAPLIISEAMAVGVPVAASRICGIPYMVEEGVSGRLFEPTKPDEIASCLERMLGQDDLEAMSAAARRSAGARYRASAVADGLVCIYRDLADQESRRERSFPQATNASLNSSSSFDGSKPS